MRLSLLITTGRPSWRLPPKRVFQRLLRRTVNAVRSRQALFSLSLAFVGDGTMETLNRRYRRKRKTTDVLSFLYEKSPQVLHGEIVISYPRAREQARTLQHSMNKEIQFLFVHGVLHLLGFDHERSKKEEEVMFALQRRILGGKASKWRRIFRRA